MDFNIKNLWALNIGGVEVWITTTVVNTWIIMSLLILAAIVVRIRIMEFKIVPGGLQNGVEALVEMFDGIMRSTAGEKMMGFLGNWYFAIFIFILVSNLSGLVGMRPPTADWTTTFAFALATFILIQAMGLKYRKGAYLKTFFEPSPVFFPLNLIGELARPISLSFRLFGNILAGMILMTLIYELAPIFVRFGIPVFLHAFFDVFAGGLQAYIFCVLSMSFVGTAAGGE